MNGEEEIGIIPPKPLPGSATTERVEIGVTPLAVINPDGGLNEWRRRNLDYTSKTTSGVETTERVEIGVTPLAVIYPDGGWNEWRRRNWDYCSKTTSGVCNHRKGWGRS